MRITTSTILRNYKNSLSTSLANMTNAQTQSLTGRNYNSVAEAPSSASKETQLQRKYAKNADYISMVQDVQSRQSSQETTIQEVVSMGNTVANSYSLDALNGTTGASERKTFATALNSFQQSILMSMNATYEDEYLFAGSDGANAPFSLDSSGNLLYRNISVDDTDALEAAGYIDDPVYVDAGFGLSFDSSGNVNSASAMDISVPGISIIGYGTTSDGTSKNLVNLAGQMADVLEADTFDSDKFTALQKQFTDTLGNVTDSLSQLGVQSNFLDSTLTRLQDNQDSLDTSITKVADIDEATALSNYSWAQYAYNAALKVGSGILSNSFIDFMD